MKRFTNISKVFTLQTVDNQACRASIAADNVVVDGEFDSDSLDSQWTVSDFSFNWDGYINQGLLIENFSTATLDLSSAPARTYNVQLYAKAYDGLPAELEVTDSEVSIETLRFEFDNFQRARLWQAVS